MKTKLTLAIISCLISSHVTVAQTGYASNGKPTKLENNTLYTNEMNNKVLSVFKDDQIVETSVPALYNSVNEFKITKLCSLDITYIQEETEGNFALGYFTHKTGAKPYSSQLSNLKMVYPRLNSEILSQGQKVQIGPFSAGTSVVFVLIKNAWQGNGKYTTNGEKILSNQQPKAAVVALEPETTTAILGFEVDEKPDFNDVLLGVSTHTFGGLKTQSFVSLADVSQKANTPKADKTESEPVTTNYYGCFSNGLSESEYKSSLYTIRNMSDDNQKINTIKSVVENHTITPSQAKEYCTQLANFSHRCNMAKYLYDYECDKSEAEMVAETMGNTNYKNDYLSYVKQKRAQEIANAQNNNTNNNNASSQQQTNTQPSTNPSANTQQPTPNNSGGTTVIIDPNINIGGTQQPYPTQYPPQPGYPSPTPYPQPGYPTGQYPSNVAYLFTQAELDNLVYQLDKLSFDSDKLQLLQRAVVQRALYTSQSLSILAQFDFDDKKLNAAKYMFDHIVDKQNYYSIQSNFTFNSTKKDFNDFLKSKGY
ncbi:MAG: DUF4476 domain-containing protein [Cytophagales bacterium]